MRELKFRLWDTKENSYVENPTLYKRLAIGCDGGVYSGKFDDTIKDRYIIEQYIGLKDKNGVEIFEGDLIKLFDDSNEIFEVVYDTYDDFPRPVFVLESENGRGDWFTSNDREVIGNIQKQ